MRRSVHLWLLVFSVGGLAAAAFVAWYLAFSQLRPAVVTYHRFEPLERTVARGGLVHVRAVYEKRRDCPGRAIVDFDDASPLAGRRIYEQALGNRAPGTFETIREFRVPEYATVGPARLCEVLLYDCREGWEVVRSPCADLTIVP